MYPGFTYIVLFVSAMVYIINEFILGITAG